MRFSAPFILMTIIGCVTTYSSPKTERIARMCRGDGCGLAAHDLLMTQGGRSSTFKDAVAIYQKGCTGRELACHEAIRKKFENGGDVDRAMNFSKKLVSAACAEGDDSACKAGPKIYRDAASAVSDSKNKAARNSTVQKDSWGGTAKQVADGCIKAANDSKDPEVVLEKCRMELIYRCDSYSNLRDVEKSLCNDTFLGQARRVEKAKSEVKARRDHDEKEKMAVENEVRKKAAIKFLAEAKRKGATHVMWLARSALQCQKQLDDSVVCESGTICKIELLKDDVPALPTNAAMGRVQGCEYGATNRNFILTGFETPSVFTGIAIVAVKRGKDGEVINGLGAHLPAAVWRQVYRDSGLDLVATQSSH
jgi:hypothetical protein